MAINITTAADNVEPRIDVTWVDLYDGADWTILRFNSSDPIATLLGKLGRLIDKGCFKYLFSVNTSKHTLHVIVGCTKSMEELGNGLFP